MARSPEPDGVTEPGDHGVDADRLGPWLARLNVCLSSAGVVRLDGGQSKASVFLLETAGDRCVLKVTVSRRWRPQALRELRFYRELAPRLPIPVPRLLGSIVVREGVALLISAHGHRTAANEWPHDQWTTVAAQAAALHRQSRSSAPPRWARRPSDPDPRSISRAVAAWQHLDHPAIAAKVPGLVTDVTRLLAQAPPTLIHGDCHVDNLLTCDEGGVVWVDWQEVTTGAGPEDLALLWQRAEFDGARPPRSAMITAYEAGLGATVGGSLERLMLAAELRLLLLEWPHFLPYGSASQRGTMLSLLQSVHEQWAS